ncbi:MAG: CocE/NonD family hydrolase [Cutibacterium granulosum]|uniref:alpha/beta hydrolase n=1 Tax=Cutibacterium granulosum TaxID=33011 RepID=UPI002B23E7BC|nr:CocE/NonD family hydrolase [Cutibacterium granulosum]MEA5635592.1 CocE/NonD family hydrolase [Cutibacterium granulosum]
MRPTSLNHRARSSLHVLICLLLIIIGAVGSSLAQRDGGKVNVQGLMIPGKDGTLVSADLFRPDTATEKNKAPMVIVSPGFQRTKETQISYSMELARRGYVTLVVDPYNQGESTSQPPTNDDPSIKPAIDYVSRTTTLNYVDKSRIGITGHSAGGSQVRRMAAEYGAKESKALKKAKSPNSPGGTTITKEEREKAEALNPIRSVFISGWLQKLDAKKFKKVHSNVGIGYAFYDEGGYRNKNGNGDLRTAPEALAVINSGLPASQHVDHVVIGKGYGSTSDRTYRVAYNDRTIHPFQPLTPSAIGSMIQFFDDTLGAPHAMSTTNQTWWLKELCNGLSLVAALVMLVPLTKLLLTIPWFSPARTEVCPAPTKPRGRGAVMFWTIFVISAAVACVTFIPLSAASQHVFSAAANKQNGWFFPGRMVNAVVLWSLVNGLFGLILLWIGHSMSKHRGADEPRNWGVRMTWAQTGRTLALALLVITIFYTILAIVYGFFHVDYRLFVVAARPLTKRWFLIGLTYVPALFPFFFSNSLRVNASMRFGNQRRWVNWLIIALANSIGLAAIFVIQYVTFFSTGTVYWTTNWLYVNMLQSLLPMMIVLPLFNRAFYHATGRVWLGPIVTTTVFALMALGGSVAYIPMF